MGPLKLAIVGAGPSAFYVASRLLSLIPHASPHAAKLMIHMYDRLWAPYGLVRYGVAPDHPEVTNCTHKFEQAVYDDRLRFFGNVNIGTPRPSYSSLSLPLDKLFSQYTHVLFSTGCTVPNLHPALPPSKYCLPALSVVHWYTLHPSKPAPPPIDRVSHVTIIGHGNVSLDVARFLLKDPIDLRRCDVPTPVLKLIDRSRVKHVSIVGRRGPLQAAFTNKELREMVELTLANMDPIDPALLTVPESGARALTRQQSRMLELLKKGSPKKLLPVPRSWSLEFFRSPTGLTVSSDGSKEKVQLTLAHTTLDENQRAVPTGETSTLETDLVITSLGHHGEPSVPWYDPSLGHLRTLNGRVVDAQGRVVRNVYASGWAAMGARGVLANTMMDAYAVADTIVRDYFEGDSAPTTPMSEADVAAEQSREAAGPVDTIEVLPKDADVDVIPPEVEAAWKKGLVTDFLDWKVVDKEELHLGGIHGKPRERMAWKDARDIIVRRRPRLSLA
ncbi:FAD/NAD-P-binding domain-containing protein [Trametes punicea]|nr:FAD/NAD-P-binding domain-containing protein [Trametes punicea]